MNQIQSTALAALTSIILELEDQLELEREAAAEATEQSADLGAEMEGARKKSKLQKFWDDKRILDLTTSLEIKRQQISFCHRQYQKDQARIDQLEHDLSSMAENADEAEDQVERLTAALEDERSKVSKWNDKFQSRIGILGDRNTRQAETLAWDAEKITELESENAELRTTLVNHIEQLAEKMEYTDELENLVARNNLQIKNLAIWQLARARHIHRMEKIDWYLDAAETRAELLRKNRIVDRLLGSDRSDDC